MGWPLDPESGESKVRNFLSQLEPLPQTADASPDLYQSLNLIRRHTWSHGSEIWERYLKTRREEVLELSSPHTGTVQLQRTVFGGHKPVTRLRVPLPFEHPAQPRLAWKILDTSVPVASMTSGIGHLDLTLSGQHTGATVTIQYDVSLLPQNEQTCVSPSAPAITGTASPFPIPTLIRERMPDILTSGDARHRVQSLWNIFLEELFSGNVYHSQYGSSETQNTSTSSRWFDCVIASWNFATLVEEMGIPARVISGVILNRFGPSPHFWCEVFFNEAWMPIDFYAWDLSWGESTWRDRFFGSLECRLRFECFPGIFARFLPSVPLFLERESAHGSAVYTYRRVDDRSTLAQDRWQASLVKG